MIKRAILCISLFFVAMVSWAQSPIKWSASFKMIDEVNGVVTFKASIANGLHLYGIDIPAGGPVPTSFNFNNSQGIDFVDSPIPSVKPIIAYDDVFGLELNWWEREVSFKQKFIVKNDKEAIIDCVVKYMACDNKSCLPPRKEHIQLKVK